MNAELLLDTASEAFAAAVAAGDFELAEVWARGVFNIFEEARS